MAQEETTKSDLEAEVDKAIAAVQASQDIPVSEQPEQEVPTPGESPSTDQVDSGTEAAAAAEPEKPVEQSPWYTDDHKELAKSYGFGDDDLGDFADEREFNRITRLLDKQLISSVQAAQPVAPPPEQHRQNGHAQTEPPATPAPAAEKPKFTKLDLAKLKEAGYDEETLGYLANQNALVEHLEQLEQQRTQERERFQTLEQGFTQFQQQLAVAEQQRRWNSFHDAVDHLSADRFGKAFGDKGIVNELNQVQDDARRKLYDTAETLAAGMAARGQQIPALGLLLRRAEQVAFAEDIAKAERAKVHQEISDQSRKRRPVQQARRNDGTFGKKLQGMTNEDRVQHIANDPDIQARLQQYQEVNAV